MTHPESEITLKVGSARLRDPLADSQSSSGLPHQEDTGFSAARVIRADELDEGRLAGISQDFSRDLKRPDLPEAIATFLRSASQIKELNAVALAICESETGPTLVAMAIGDYSNPEFARKSEGTKEFISHLIGLSARANGGEFPVMTVPAYGSTQGRGIQEVIAHFDNHQTVKGQDKVLELKPASRMVVITTKAA